MNGSALNLTSVTMHKIEKIASGDVKSFLQKINKAYGSDINKAGVSQKQNVLAEFRLKIRKQPSKLS
jgi:hypothetical protein